MNYYLDTEFIEHKDGIDLVSIGIFSEDGRKFYAESSDFNPELADDWVRENVFKKLSLNPFDFEKRKMYSGLVESTGAYDTFFGSNKMIADAILEFIGDDKEPVFYAYFGAYDWVIFARLFGRLIDKPDHFPMYVMDIKQMMHERNLSKDWKREHCPDPEGNHNALEDAMWNRDLHHAIIKWEEDNYHKKFNALREKLSIILQDDRWIEGSDITEILNEILILEAISHYGYLRYPPRREMEESFMNRLKTELQELIDKHTKLETFMFSEKFTDLSYANRSLLNKQSHLMNQYVNVLRIRIELLESQSRSNNNIEILKSKSK